MSLNTAGREPGKGEEDDSTCGCSSFGRVATASDMSGPSAGDGARFEGTIVGGWLELVNGWMTQALPAAGTNALATSAFATYVLSLVGYGVYLIHGLLPPDTLRSTLMISYFPSQVWATILPAWLTVAVWYLFLAYFATNLSYTPPIHGSLGLASITDLSALILNPPSIPTPYHPPHKISSHDLPVPILRDLPCQVVNQFYFD
ncbi:hypothetical protein VP01_1099g6 [Puccinia sorghi]|uniref:PIG-P domain-containing protein n=1 Tax=Puccinia sorghi TaxID=27349 RepID=A0A0L6VSY1_9BASI|nr:hypothetical protein VP01_1099g6 [Puccinia sorghi]